MGFSLSHILPCLLSAADSSLLWSRLKNLDYFRQMAVVGARDYSAINYSNCGIHSGMALYIVVDALCCTISCTCASL